jgi:hypothetical protein
VNLKIELELDTPEDILRPTDYLANFYKNGSKYFANLIDLASEEEKSYAFTTSSASCSATYTFDDLVIYRAAQGGQRISL